MPFPRSGASGGVEGNHEFNFGHRAEGCWVGRPCGETELTVEYQKQNGDESELTQWL